MCVVVACWIYFYEQPGSRTYRLGYIYCDLNRLNQIIFYAAILLNIYGLKKEKKT